MSLSRRLGLLATSAALVACSAEVYYNVLHEQQKDVCRRLLNFEDQTNCIKRISKPYEAYKVDEETARSGGKRVPAE